MPDTVAFEESVLHKLESNANGSRNGRTLKLAKLYGAALLRPGGNGELSGTPNYTLPQAWAAALVAHSAKIDGFIYMSRRVNDSFAVVLFERDPAKCLGIRMDQDVLLHQHPDYLAAEKYLGATLT